MDTLHRRAEVRSADDLGWVLAEVRGQRHETQTSIAQSLAMNRTQLAHLEAGRSGRYLANLLDLLERLDARLVIEWTVATDTTEPTDAASVVTPTRRVRNKPVDELSNGIQEQVFAMMKALEPIGKTDPK